jgi:hypothetical protein
MSDAFAERLLQILAKRFPAGSSDYVRVDTLRMFIAEALRPDLPASEQFPRMLYRNSEQKIVDTAEEEKSALSQGFSRDAPPAFPPGYPRWFSERIEYKIWDRRRVMLRSFAELEQFLAAVEAENWVEDAENTWGSRGVALSDLIGERRELLKQMIDTQALETFPSVSADAGAGASTTPSISTPPRESER